MFLNIIFTIFLLCFFGGIGHLVLSLFKIRQIPNPFLHIFIGIFILSVFAMGVSLFISLSPSFFVLMILFSSFGILKWLSDREYLAYKNSFKLPLIFVLLSIVIVSMIMGYAEYPFNSDTDFYHANAVRWLREYGTVVGLANLNQRLGVNTSWHVLGAVLDHFVFQNRTTWLLPLLAYSSSLGFFIWEIFNSKELWRKVFSLFILCWTCINILTWAFPSLHYDFMPLIYNAILTYNALIFSFKQEKENSVSDLMILFWLGTASFLLKPMGAMSILFIIIFILYYLSKEKKLRLQPIAMISILPLLSFVIWIARNIMLSGWLFFPTPHFSLSSLDWTTPHAITFKTYADVLTWARMPLPGHEKVINQPFSYWFGTWLKLSFTSVRFWLVGVIPFLIGLVAWISIRKKIFAELAFFFLLWTISSLLFWFILAPDIRFGDGFFVVFAAVAVSFFVRNQFPLLNLKAEFLIGSVALMLSILALSFSLLVFKGKRGPINLFMIGFHESGPIEQITIRGDENKEKLKVWVPVNIKNCKESSNPHICPKNEKLYEEFSMCSNSPLPCTGYFSNKLRLRVEGKLEKGFYLK